MVNTASFQEMKTLDDFVWNSAKGAGVNIWPSEYPLLQKALIVLGTQKVSIWCLGRALIAARNLVLKVLTFWGPFAHIFFWQTQIVVVI